MESTDSTIAEGTHLKGLSSTPTPHPSAPAAGVNVNSIMDDSLTAQRGIEEAVAAVEAVMRDLMRTGETETIIELVHTPLRSHAYSREATIRRQAFVAAAIAAREELRVESFTSTTGARDEVRIPGVLDRYALIQPVRLNNEQYTMGQLTVDEHRAKIAALRLDIAGRMVTVDIHEELVRIIEAAGVRCADDVHGHYVVPVASPAEDD